MQILLPFTSLCHRAEHLNKDPSFIDLSIKKKQFLPWEAEAQICLVW